MSLTTAVIAATAIALVVIGAFAEHARRDGADKAAFHLLWPASALVLGVIAALAYKAGVWG